MAKQSKKQDMAELNLGNFETITRNIDSVSIKLQAAKGLGKSVQELKDAATSTYQWTVADYIYRERDLVAIFSHWLDNSKLVGEARRTAKDALTNAVKAWGEGNLDIQVNERTVGNKLRGVHVRYLRDLEQERRDYMADVKALASAFKKHGRALYDALAMLEMERQEAGKVDTSKDAKTIAKAFANAQAKTVADMVAAERANILANIA